MRQVNLSIADARKLLTRMEEELAQAEEKVRQSRARHLQAIEVLLDAYDKNRTETTYENVDE